MRLFINLKKISIAGYCRMPGYSPGAERSPKFHMLFSAELPLRGGADWKIGSTPEMIFVATNWAFALAAPPETTTACPGFKSDAEILGKRSIICVKSPRAKPAPLGPPVEPPAELP
jgi:hypothetical protein